MAERALPAGHRADRSAPAIRYALAQRRFEVPPGFRMREVRRLCPSGHQTAILTTRHDHPIEVVAYRMFERWTQENFFRYMRQHFALERWSTTPWSRPTPSARPEPRAQGAAKTTERDARHAQGARADVRARGPVRTSKAGGHRIANFIWGIADDVLRDLYVRGKYRDVILPMIVIRRLDSLLEPTKESVLDNRRSRTLTQAQIPDDQVRSGFCPRRDRPPRAPDHADPPSILDLPGVFHMAWQKERTVELVLAPYNG